MQTKNPFLEEMARLGEAAAGLAQAAQEEARSAMRAQADKWVAELDLIRRDEFEALKAQVGQLRDELASLKGAAAPKAAPKTAGKA
ncbi:MAG TPA: accessory factor UbiK family protein [Caulobacteraceae bacterium]|nr:accessory factor UbiK family protein [Caulobacteraceae bacterium]